MRLVRDFVTAAEEEMLAKAVDERPWLDDLKRRVQHYGWRYAYKGRTVSPDDDLGPLPEFLEPYAARVADATGATRPDQIIVNEYLPGQGIAPHVDAPAFGPTIASLSLLSTTFMDLTNGDRRVELRLPERSLLILQGQARTGWRHSIRARKSDVFEGTRVPRARRLSLTFRSVA